jgi:hypothetical protein
VVHDPSKLGHVLIDFVATADHQKHNALDRLRRVDQRLVGELQDHPHDIVEDVVGVAARTDEAVQRSQEDIRRQS